MSKDRNELVARQILQNFVNNVVPEYILDSAHQVLEQGGVQRISLQQSDDYWEVEASVQGEDFQVYSPK